MIKASRLLDKFLARLPSLGEWADEHGFDRTYLWRLRKGESVASRKKAREIEKATKGYVPTQSWDES